MWIESGIEKFSQEFCDAVCRNSVRPKQWGTISLCQDAGVETESCDK